MRPADLTKFLQFTLASNLNVLIKGKPGVGKTSIVKKATKALGYKLIVSHPVVSDPTDYKGLPYAQNGKAKFLPYSDLEQLIEADEPTVFFLDDLGQASTAVQAAVMQLLLARHIGEHKISDHVRFVAATNGKADMAGVTGILAPVKSRFASIVELEVDDKDWCEWAMLNNMPAELVGFIRFKPSILNEAIPSKDMVNTVSPRTLDYVGQIQLAKCPAELEFEAFSGAAGEAFAAEYRGFLTLYREIPDLAEILSQPQTARLPANVSVHFALATLLGQHMDAQNITPILTYLSRLPRELETVAMMDASKRHRESGSTDLFKSQVFVDWAMKNQSINLG